MRRTRLSLAAVVLAASASLVVSGQTTSRSALHDYRVVTVVDALVQPWSIAFLPGGDTLITERPGTAADRPPGQAPAAGRSRACRRCSTRRRADCSR